MLPKNKWRLLAIALVFIIVLAIISLPIINKLARSSGPQNVTIERGSDPNRRACNAFPVPCDGEGADFCSNACVENLEYSCQPVYDVIRVPLRYQERVRARVERLGQHQPDGVGLPLYVP